MTSWPVQDAKARFSEMLSRCLGEGPQLVTRRGVDAAVLVPIEEWERLKGGRRPGRKEVLMTDYARGDIPSVDFETLPLPALDFEFEK